MNSSSTSEVMTYSLISSIYFFLEFDLFGREMLHHSYSIWRPLYIKTLISEVRCQVNVEENEKNFQVAYILRKKSDA